MNLFLKIKSFIKLMLNYNVSGKYSKIRKSDIFLISYPKSGNTWLRFIFGNIIYKDVDFNNINLLIPDIYMSTKRQIDKLKNPRIIKTHEQYSEKYPKVIYIYRDPRDVVVSYYYWEKKFKKPEKNSFNEFFERFINGNLPYGLWSDHVNKWKEMSLINPENIYVVRYEDLKLDTFREVKKILNFCNLNISDIEILEAIKKSEFKNMQKLEEKQKESSFLKNTNQKIKFVRSGKSEWNDMLNEEQLNRLYNKFKTNIKEYV